MKISRLFGVIALAIALIGSASAYVNYGYNNYYSQPYGYNSYYGQPTNYYTGYYNQPASNWVYNTVSGYDGNGYYNSYNYAAGNVVINTASYYPQINRCIGNACGYWNNGAYGYGSQYGYGGTGWTEYNQVYNSYYGRSPQYYGYTNWY